MRMRKEVFILNVDDILPNRFQPRIKFDEKAILELAESIKKHGVIQPIIVRKIADKYEIIAGERRYKASIIAGRKTIPAIITDVDDKESAEVALTENVQRQDMTPIEEAISYKKILDMGYLNQSELATKLGKTQSTIANKLRLLNLSDEVQEALLEEKISERHARSLLRLPNSQQPDILQKIINERLTVRKTDQLINSILNPNIKEIEEIKEEKGENMNNNFDNINNNFNIPSEPIIDNSNNNPNPGFMNIDNIANNAQDISNNVNEIKNPFNPYGDVQNNPVSNEQIPQGNIFESQSMPMQPAQDPNAGFNSFNMNQGIPAQQAPVPNTEINPFDMNQGAPIQPAQDPNTGFNPFEMNQGTPIQPAQDPNTGFNPFDMNQGASIQPAQDSNTGFNSFDMNQGMVGSQSMPELNSNSFVSTPNYPLPETQELTPLMPEVDNRKNKVDFNTIINTMRDCIRQIENYGYKVDSDESDLPQTYEFTIKIDKN